MRDLRARAFALAMLAEHYGDLDPVDPAVSLEQLIHTAAPSVLLEAIAVAWRQRRPQRLLALAAELARRLEQEREQEAPGGSQADGR